MKQYFRSENRILPENYQFMKKILNVLFILLMVSSTTLNARKSSNISIYDYLKTNVRFTTYVRLIDDLNLTNDLSSAGDRTLFVANDSAFTEFFKNNPWNVSSYGQLTLAQKKYLLKFSLLNHAYTLSNIGNQELYEGLIENSVMRRPTSLIPQDSIPYVSGDLLPAGKFWDSRRQAGYSVLSDNTTMPLLFFTQGFMDKHSFTDEDLKFILGIKSRSNNDVYIFNDKVIQRDIECNNEYINVLESVLIPPKNMAQYISDNKTGDATQTTKIFSKLLDRFCAPYFDPTSTTIYKQLHPEFNDSVFVKHYFSQNGGATFTPKNQYILYRILYDPGWNSYQNGYGTLEKDMAAMFVPSDEAMTNYLNSGIGTILKYKYGSWDNIPDELIYEFINRCMRTFLIESVPGKFSKMVDAQNYRLPVEKSDIVKTYTGVNGVVYVTNKVYPQIEFTSTYSPVLLSNNTKIMNWAIKITQQSIAGTRFAFYRLYLNSSMAKYSLFVPTDECFSNYIDPIAYGQDVQGILKFRYNSTTNAVYATTYKYNKNTGEVGDSVNIITNPVFIQNRLWKLLDSHIVVGEISEGKQYYITKGNDIIRCQGSGTNMTIEGGGNIQNSTKVRVNQIFPQSNGNTYFLNSTIQPSLKSVYEVLKNDTDFSEFYHLIADIPVTYANQIFSKQGVDYRVRFFNAFNYTIYVPTNAAIKNAISSGKIKSWATINAITNTAMQEIEIAKLVQLLRYHFQDKAVFFGETVDNVYQSATIKSNNNTTYWNSAENKFLKIGVVGSSSSMQLRTETNSTANVTTKNNIIAKDYLFSELPSLYQNVDGTGSVISAPFYLSDITTSSSAVIHQIDNVLSFE